MPGRRLLYSIRISHYDRHDDTQHTLASYSRPLFRKRIQMCVSRLAWVRWAVLPLCPVRLGEATQWHRFRCLRRGDASANQAMAIARDENEAHPSTALGLAGEKATHACVLLGSSRAWWSASAVASAPIAPSSLSVGRWGVAFGLPPHLSDTSRSYSPKRQRRRSAYVLGQGRKAPHAIGSAQFALQKPRISIARHKVTRSPINAVRPVSQSRSLRCQVWVSWMVRRSQALSISVSPFRPWQLRYAQGQYLITWVSCRRVARKFRISVSEGRM